MRSRSTLLAVAVVAFLMALLVGANAVRLRRIRADAERFRDELVRLQVPDSTAAEIQNLARRYAGYLKQSSCRDTSCTFSFEFSNSLFWPAAEWAWKRGIPLWRVGFVRQYNWGAGIQTHNGHASLISAGAISKPDEVLADTVQYANSHTESYELLVNRIEDGNGRPWRLLVRVRPGAPMSVRKRAYAYDLGCLQRLVVSCKDASELAPQLWPRGAPPVSSE